MDCKGCGRELHIAGVDSNGHEIIIPCSVCERNLQMEHVARAAEMTTICDECGGALKVNKKTKKKTCTNKKCRMVYQ